MRALSDLGRLTAHWKNKFLRDTRGNTAMMFGLSTIVLLSAAGGAIDWSRAMVMKTRLATALDAAALAVGTTNGLTDQQLQTMAQNYFDANYPAGTIGTPSAVSVVRSGQTMSLSVTATVPTTLLKVAHIDTLDLSVSNQVVRAVTKLRVALVLDNTGSMSQSDATGTTKISALKTASHQLLTQLQAAAINQGDVQVALVPFALDVNIGTGNVNSNWLDWTDWNSAPPNQTWLSAANNNGGSIGPGSTCPFGTSTNQNISPYGYRCTQGPSNGSTNTNTIPSSGAYKGYICPGMDSGTYNAGRGGHYYNGCYTSTPTQTSTTTGTNTTPITIKQNCSQTGAGAITCTNKSGYPSNGSTTSASNTVVTAGYSGDSGPTTTSNTTTTSTTDGSKTCSGPVGNKTCTWTRTILQSKVDTTVTATGVGPYTHAWVANNHNTWGGCVMDRQQSNDVSNATPVSGNLPSQFPPENNAYCPPAGIKAMSYDWTGLSNAVDAMTPNGSTNQTIGFVWGWQALSQGDPLNAPASDNLTSDVIIILSDGLNTQNRFGGDGVNQSTQVDDREALACTAAKQAGVLVYTLFVDLGGTQGNSAPLANCATDSSKYFDLTSSGQIVTAFTQIGTELANLHLAQ